MERLESIVEAMESGAVGIEESISKYEEAMALAAICRQILDDAEQRVRKIQLDAAGGVSLVDFEPGREDADGEADEAGTDDAGGAA